MHETAEMPTSELDGFKPCQDVAILTCRTIFCTLSTCSEVVWSVFTDAEVKHCFRYPMIWILYKFPLITNIAGGRKNR